MGAFDGVNNRFIKLFSYVDDEGKVNDVKTFYGQKWSDVKTKNASINSIFTAIDDGDGIVQAKELNLLNKIFLYIDNLFSNTAGNEILEKEEIDKFAEKVNAGEIDIKEIISEEQNDESVQNWSEGLDRNISLISLSKFRSNKISTTDDLIKELKIIGDEQGFSVQEIESGGDIWVEDSSIRRHDGKVYVPYHSDPNFEMDDVKSTFVSSRGNKSVDGGTRVVKQGYSFDREIANKDKFYGTSYLEGGNVLNTLSKDGKPSAIIGEGSVGATLGVMGLDSTPENIQRAKEQIAAVLNIDLENITFIPQYDFHIDMLYRPLHNGEIAIPDFDEAIKILEENFIPSLETEDSSEKKEALINQLKQLKDSTKNIREEAEDNLVASGYKLVKIPCFTTDKSFATNFMNGVGGTSIKTGETFYITNKSEYPELQSLIEPYFKNAGIDKVYFVSTTENLRKQGGIDCLTQEE